MPAGSFSFSARPEPARRQVFFLAICVAGFLVLFWSQALHVPYWQDDYYYLLDARQAGLAGEPWHAAFVPESRVTFWRPLGMETYWRFVEGMLGGDARAAHLVNILLLVAAAGMVGWFVSTLVRLLAPENDGPSAGLFAALLYGVHSSHFLPVAWAAAANGSLAVLFSALALRFWLTVSTTPDRRRALSAGLATCLSFGLALLSRDIAFVLPALGLLLTFWLRPRHRPTPVTWATGAVCLLIALVWLLLRNHFTLATDPAYHLRIGTNVLRNGSALLLFAFNTPFEALRFFFFVAPSVKIAAWGLLSLAPQVAAFVLLLRGARQQAGRKELGILAAFFVIGCGPAFLFSVNCYPYYTSLGLFAYAVIAGLASRQGRLVPAVLLLAILSSAVATVGNFFLDSPSHIGRAVWAERQLVRLEAMREARPALFTLPLVVAVEDDHRFLGFRAEGIAWRLGMELAEIEVRDAEETEGLARPVLVVPAEGDAYFRLPGTAPHRSDRTDRSDPTYQQ